VRQAPFAAEIDDSGDLRGLRRGRCPYMQERCLDRLLRGRGGGAASAGSACVHPPHERV